MVLAATSAYYAVLNARSQLEVQENNLRISQANLELAEERVRLGSSSAADVYRWEAEVARALILVLNARSAESQSWETLNRVLHRPQGERFALRQRALRLLHEESLANEPEADHDDGEVNEIAAVAPPVPRDEVVERSERVLAM